MKSIRIATIVLLQAVLFLTIAGALTAAASPPEVQLVQIDETRTAPGLTRICGFTVMRHDAGTLRVHSFYRDGQLVRDVENDHLVATFTADDANGPSVIGRTGGIVMDTYNPDGSYTLLSTGPGDHIAVPGYGYVLGVVGNLLIEVDADGNETVVREVGNNQLTHEAYEAVCAALAP